MEVQARYGAALAALLFATCATALTADAAGGVPAPLSVEAELRPISPTVEFLSNQSPRVSALSGDTAALVVHKAEPVGTVNVLHGQIYIYQRTLGAWSVQAVIAPSDPADSVFFGRSIALQGDTLVVGVSNPSPEIGFTTPPQNPTSIRAAYIYQRLNGVWTQKARLVGRDALTATYDFGADVAISGPTIAIAATGGLRQQCTNTCVTLEQRAGATYIFDRNALGGWTQSARIVTSSPYGGLAGFNGNTLAVPNVVKLSNGRFIGRVAVYQRTAGVWSRQALLAAADQTPASQLLSSTPPAVTHGLFSGLGTIATPAIDGDTLLVGGSDTAANGVRGSVYVFQRTGATWTQQAKIIPKGSKLNDGFGFRIALSGNAALVGNFFPKPSLFVRNGAAWTETEIPSPGVETRKHVDMFSLSLAIDQSTALITQPFTRAMVYAISPAP